MYFKNKEMENINSFYKEHGYVVIKNFLKKQHINKIKKKNFIKKEIF